MMARQHKKARKFLDSYRQCSGPLVLRRLLGSFFHSCGLMGISSGDFQWRFSMEMLKGDFQLTVSIEIFNGDVQLRCSMDTSNGDFQSRCPMEIFNRNVQWRGYRRFSIDI